MKKRNLTILSVLFGICFLAFACRRELNNITGSNQSTVPQSLLESAKILNSKTLGDNSALNASTPGFFTLSPQWDKATTLVDNKGTTVLVVPTIENEITNRAVSIRRAFLFDSANGQVVNGRIVEFIGINYAVTPQLETLVKGVKDQKINGFTGAILQYDLNYRRIGGIMYSSGYVTASNVILSKSDDGSGTYLYQVTHNSDGSTTFSQLSFLYDKSVRAQRVADVSLSEVNITTSPVSGGGDNTGGTGGTYGGPTPPPTTGNTGGSGGQDIVNNLAAGCNHNAADKITSAGLKGALEALIQSTFNSGDKLNLIFEESAAYDAPAHSIPQFAGGGVINCKVYINSPKFPANASQDYRANLMLHEIVHQYLTLTSKNLKTEIQQHAEIANNWVDKIAGTLNSAFGTDLQAGRALAIDGLKNYAISQGEAGYNNLLGHYGLDGLTMLSLVGAYREGSSGKTCNQN